MPGERSSGRAPPPPGPGPGRGLRSRLCSAGRPCAEQRQAAGCRLGQGVGGVSPGAAGDAAPLPRRRTHPGLAPAGKWQRQWKAAAQCAHRSASAPSPHTPHRAPGAGPCRADRAVTPGQQRGATDPAPSAPPQGPRWGWTAGARGGVREVWGSLPQAVRGALHLRAAAQRNQVSWPVSPLVGPDSFRTGQGVPGMALPKRGGKSWGAWGLPNILSPYCPASF